MERGRRIKCKAKRSSWKREREKKNYFSASLNAFQFSLLLRSCVLAPLFIVENLFFFILHTLKRLARAFNEIIACDHTLLDWFPTSVCSAAALMSHRGKINFIILFLYFIHFIFSFGVRTWGGRKKLELRHTIWYLFFSLSHTSTFRHSKYPPLKNENLLFLSSTENSRHLPPLIILYAHLSSIP